MRKNKKKIDDSKKGGRRAGLTDMMYAFVQHYIVDWNATKAAIKAGYAPKNANRMGYTLLQREDVQSEIEKAQADIAKAAGISALRNLLELKKIAYADITEVVETWDKIKDVSELSDDARAFIKTVTNRKGCIIIETHDKLKSIEIINKMLGFNAADKVEHSGSAVSFHIVERKPGEQDGA